MKNHLHIYYFEIILHLPVFYLPEGKPVVYCLKIYKSIFYIDILQSEKAPFVSFLFLKTCIELISKFCNLHFL